MSLHAVMQFVLVYSYDGAVGMASSCVLMPVVQVNICYTSLRVFYDYILVPLPVLVRYNSGTIIARHSLHTYCTNCRCALPPYYCCTCSLYEMMCHTRERVEGAFSQLSNPNFCSRYKHDFRRAKWRRRHSR